MSDTTKEHPSVPGLITRKELEQRKLVFTVEDILPNVHVRRLAFESETERSLSVTTSLPEDASQTITNSSSPSSKGTGSSNERDSPVLSSKHLQPKPAAKITRSMFSAHQVYNLNRMFERQHYLGTKEREELALKLNMTDDQVKTWFQNRRMKVKRKRTEDTQYYSKLAYMNSIANSLHPQYPGIHGYHPPDYPVGYPSVSPRSYYGYTSPRHPSLHRSAPPAYGAFHGPEFCRLPGSYPEYPNLHLSSPCRECPGPDCRDFLPPRQVHPYYTGFL